MFTPRSISGVYLGNMLLLDYLLFKLVEAWEKLVTLLASIGGSMEPRSMEMGSMGQAEGNEEQSPEERHETARRAREYTRIMGELVEKLETTRALDQRDMLQKQLDDALERFKQEAGKL